MLSVLGWGSEPWSLVSGRPGVIEPPDGVGWLSLPVRTLGAGGDQLNAASRLLSPRGARESRPAREPGSAQPGTQETLSWGGGRFPVESCPACCVDWACPWDSLGRGGLARSCSGKGHVPSVSACVRLLLGAFTWLFFLFCPELIIIIDKRTSLIQIILSSLECRSASG